MYVLGLFGSFAILKMFIMMTSLFGILYHSQYHASAAVPISIDPANCDILSPQVSKDECMFLADLYNSTNGPAWTDMTNRSNTNFSNICSWKGITCGIPGHITHIDLANNNLQGDIPASISKMVYLEGLLLQYNKITSIPKEIGLIGGIIKTFNPSYNLLTSLPDEIGDLSGITELDLSYNQLTNLPTKLSTGYIKTNLTKLYINNNLINKLPNYIGNFEKLTILDASYNNIKSIYPIYINSRSLGSIQEIDFSHNFIEKIDPEIGNIMDSIKQIDLSYNRIGDVSKLMKTSAPNLTHLNLRHNSIGDVDDGIAKTLNSLLVLDLGKNLLNSGAVSIIGNLSKLTHLYLDHNLIDSIPKKFKNFVVSKNLRVIDLSYNNLSYVNYINEIGSLLEINLENNSISNTFDITQILNLESINLGFNQLKGDFTTIVERLMEKKSTLKYFSVKHNQLNGSISEKIMDFSHPDFKCDISYNRLESYNVGDNGTLRNFLNNHCLDTSSVESYKNTDWNRQYRHIDMGITASLVDPSTPIHPGDTIEVKVDYQNKTSIDSDILDLHIFESTGVFTIDNPTDWTPAMEDSTFDESDICRKNLESYTSGPYVEALTERANKNGRSTFHDYLLSIYRDYDLYAIGSYDPYSSSWGGEFTKWIEQYTYEAFDKTFGGGLFTRLFDLDLNDLAYNDGTTFCGLNGKLTSRYDRNPVYGLASDSVTYVITIDPSFVGDFNFGVRIKSDNRRFIDNNDSNNDYNLTIKVEEILVDTDSDGIYDGEDNCVYVANPGQEDSNIVTGSTVLFTEADYADETDPANRDCIDGEVCLTRAQEQPLYNAVYQTSGDVSIEGCNANPKGTERAIGNCSEKDSLVFDKLFVTNNCYPIEMTKYAMCLHTISSDKYYDISFSDWTKGGFSYTRTEYIELLGDACDCNDEKCTLGNDIYNKPICDPLEPECSGTTCGNNIIEDTEACDGTNLNGKTCADYGYNQGNLSCSPSCTLVMNCSNRTSGGGGGGLHKDDCNGQDLSPSYYDGTCAAPSTPMHTAPSTDKPITRKDMAQLASTFAIDVLGLEPDRTRPCEFNDIGHLSKTEQQAITNACMLNIMGVHKDGIAIKINFDPLLYINEKDFAAVLSRTIYDGKYNLELNSQTPRYTKHVAQIKKIGLLPPVGSKVMLSFVIEAFDTIKNDLSLVSRSDFTSHAAAPEKPTTSAPGTAAKTGTTVTTSPATSVSTSLRMLLQDLKKFFILKPYEPQDTTPMIDEETTHAAAEEKTTTNQNEIRGLKDFLKFFR